MKKEPFDLQAVLNGAEVVTRDGRKVKRVEYFPEVVECCNYPVIAAIEHSSLVSFTKEGREYKRKEDNSPRDLFLVGEECEKTMQMWVRPFGNIGGRPLGTKTLRIEHGDPLNWTLASPTVFEFKGPAKLVCEWKE